MKLSRIVALYCNTFDVRQGDGQTIIVGAPIEEPSGLNNGGSAYVFILSGSEWIEQAKLVSTDVEAEDRFGSSVSISVSSGLTSLPRNHPL